MILILNCVRVPGVTHRRKHNHICIHSYTHTHTHVTYKHRCTHAHIHTPTFTLRPDADSHKPRAITFHASARTSRKTKHDFAAREGVPVRQIQASRLYTSPAFHRSRIGTAEPSCLAEALGASEHARVARCLALTGAGVYANGSLVLLADTTHPAEPQPALQGLAILLARLQVGPHGPTSGASGWVFISFAIRVAII